ncbi:hypothetical protein CYMTET_24449 [Cymbomonas tetramitiformis]|uniref:Prolyl 4-hydroxylase alpha subunit domain-containing protein n=1 Tax=Cymbomonas tetramitiformis TaxID=36881 RepID=A0AAE0L094_9CHLO|nr:hypothetical protein CYMTET_24449 [Cymbomonas tetramitiformis]|eukprot:gene2128-2826_t
MTDKKITVNRRNPYPFLDSKKNSTAMGDDDVWNRMFALAAQPTAARDKQPEKRSEAQSAKYRTSLNAWLSPSDISSGPTALSAAAADFHRKLNMEPAIRGVIKVENFLPPDVAEGVLQAFESAPKASWSVAQAKNDAGRKEDGAGSVRHKYNVGDGTSDEQGSSRFGEEAAATMNGLQSAIQSLFPFRRCSFQAGKYTKGCFIEPHDDVAYKDVDGVRYEREIAVIYYLTKDWNAEMGGCFVDLELGLEHVPAFNSLVAFRVPRLHQVTELYTSRDRFSMFGWFYKPVHEGEVVENAGTQQTVKRGGKRGHEQCSVSHRDNKLLTVKQKVDKKTKRKQKKRRVREKK